MSNTPLTPREYEVLELLAMGFMNPEIAERLVVSVRTVEAHRSAIVRKTRCRTRAELIAYALAHGVVRG
jgi:two-component system response regulator NreC